MKITSKLLHIPPYLSTSWVQIRTIYLKETDLVISLPQGEITIPGLSPEIREQIFAAYGTFLEEPQTRISMPHQEKPASFQLFQLSSNPGSIPPTTGIEGATIRFGMDSLDSFSSAMQHNMAQSHMPNLPKEILEKIAAVARAVAPEEVPNMPKPEPHCNCTHCQIARAIHYPMEETDNQLPSTPILEIEVKEEIISDADLSFQQWEINQTGEKLYAVANRLDSQERYSVYLGHPVGCTCGKHGCEHILAVLKS